MRQALRYALLLAIFAVLLFPCWLMVVNSFSPARAFLRRPPSLLPYAWTLENYVRAFTTRGVATQGRATAPLMPRWLANTGVMAAVLVGAGVLINGAAGYAFAFARARWLRIVFWVFMAPIFVSGYVLLISQVIIVNKLGLSGMAAVLSMMLYWATGVFLFRNYFRTIPHEILESARIDGAGEWRILLQVVLPISGPILGASIVFLGMAALGSYLWPMLILQRSEEMTFLVGLLSTTLNVYAVRNIGYDLTVGTLLFLPYLALFAVSSRYFIKGLTGGALKA